MRVRVAAYQAPLLPVGSMAALDMIADRIRFCEAEDVRFLCCPEAILGGLADYAERPADFAVAVEDGALERLLAPLASRSVTAIIGFTEIGSDGLLYNAAAVIRHGTVAALYRKRHPALRKSRYSAGTESPVFCLDGLCFGVMICNDSNFPDLAQSMARGGAKVIFVPTNNALPPEKSDVLHWTRKTDHRRATESNIAIVRADVAGRAGGLVSLGSSSIVGADGTLLAKGAGLRESILVADLDISETPAKLAE